MGCDSVETSCLDSGFRVEDKDKVELKLPRNISISQQSRAQQKYQPDISKIQFAWVHWEKNIFKTEK